MRDQRKHLIEAYLSPLLTMSGFRQQHLSQRQLQLCFQRKKTWLHHPTEWSKANPEKWKTNSLLLRHLPECERTPKLILEVYFGQGSSWCLRSLIAWSKYCWTNIEAKYILKGFIYLFISILTMFQKLFEVTYNIIARSYNLETGLW